MAFKSYRTRPYEHTHENSFFRKLSTELGKVFNNQEGLNILIGNISCNGSPIDSIFISKGKIIVIDFKNYGGTLKFSENNAWQIQNGNDLLSVKGGGGIRNPYQQVNEYRFSLINFLSSKQNEFLEPNHNNINLGHISAMVIFHQPITFDDNEIPQKINKYFSITDNENYINAILDRATNRLNFSDIEINNILSSLDINEENLFIDASESALIPQPDKSKNSLNKNPSLLPIELVPPDVEKFKEILLLKKQATITTLYKDGTTQSKTWDASKMTASSNIKGNLRSRAEFRNGNWQNFNIEKVVVHVTNHTLDGDENSSINLKKIDSIYNPRKNNFSVIENNLIDLNKKNIIRKEDVIKLINESFNLKLNTNNTNWSNINSTGIWSIEPNIVRKSHNLYLVLNNNNSHKIHLFEIPANHKVYDQLYFRNDKAVFRLLFNLSDNEFIETLNNINFKNFYRGFIDYAKPKDESK